MNDSRPDARPPRREDDRGRRGDPSGPRQASRGGKPHPSMTPKGQRRRDDAGSERGRDRGRDVGAGPREFGARDDGRPARPPHDDPPIPDEVTPKALPADARNELKTLSAENQEYVARHLAMAARLIDADPALAHNHALSASRRGGRIGIVRETLAITAYATGDFGLALRELRTYRRITGRDDQLPMMVDCERGLGRPDRALELGRSVPRSTLPAAVQVELAIAMSGARLDLGQAEAALRELEIPQLDPTRAFAYSPDLFDAYAIVLAELGREPEARDWHRRARVAAEALGDAGGPGLDGEGLDVVDLEDDEAEDDAVEGADGAAEEGEPA